MFKINSLILLVGVVVFNGCGSVTTTGCGCDLEEIDMRSSLTTESDCSQSRAISLNSEDFSSGETQNSVLINNSSSDELALSMTVDSGTQFEYADEDGKNVETMPRYLIEQSRSSESSIKSEVKFVDDDCRMLIPSKSVDMSLDVSMIEVQPEDRVYVGTSDGTRESDLADENKNIDVELSPQMFRDSSSDALVVIASAPRQTGAEGGN